jgi:hypothetical protein
MRKTLVAALLFCLSAVAVAQQDYVGRYEAYAGFSYLDSPALNLTQRDFNTQEGINLRRWLAVGFDYSIQEGHGTLLPTELKPSLQTLLPPIPGLYVPFGATTQTFTGGPQLAYRHFKRFTLFAHPSIGAIHEHINLEPNNSTTQTIVGGLIQLGVLKSSAPSDTTYFYGFGGGGDFNATKHIHLRCDIEFVHVFLFDGLLANSRNSLRVSIGPSFSFGKNVAK